MTPAATKAEARRKRISGKTSRFADAMSNKIGFDKSKERTRNEVEKPPSKSNGRQDHPTRPLDRQNETPRQREARLRERARGLQRRAGGGR